MTAGPTKPRQPSLPRFIALPENAVALQAVRDLAAFFHSERTQPPCNPLFLHGPPGTGKSYLSSSLAAEVAQSGKTVRHLTGAAIRLQPRGGAPAQSLTAAALDRSQSPVVMPANAPKPFLEELQGAARDCDLLIIEDLPHLPLAAAETLVALIEERLVYDLPMLFTATVGPAQLGHRGVKFPARLTGRLAAGLTVALQPLQPASRHVFLVEMAQRSQLPLGPEVADWLAANIVANGRQLEGAIRQLETLSRLGKRLDLETVSRHFRPDVDASRPTVDRIVEHVGGYFRVDPGALQSRRRYRSVLVPRQVGMYLARQLTRMSLDQIGRCFGGRDHSTVLHACRKVEEAMRTDARLCGAVKELHAELT